VAAASPNTSHLNPSQVTIYQSLPPLHFFFIRSSFFSTCEGGCRKTEDHGKKTTDYGQKTEGTLEADVNPQLGHNSTAICCRYHCHCGMCV